MIKQYIITFVRKIRFLKNLQFLLPITKSNFSMLFHWITCTGLSFVSVKPVIRFDPVNRV